MMVVRALMRCFSLGESQTLFDVLSHLPATEVIRKSLDEGVQAIKRRRTTTSPSIDLMRYLVCILIICNTTYLI